MSAKINDGLTPQQRFRIRHRERIAEEAKEKYHASPEKFRARNRAARQRKVEWQRRSLGLPEPTRPEPAGCESCGKLREERMKKQGLCADHCHKTNKFRGWLCTGCNMSIGNLGDDVQGLERAIAYLRRSA